jgi:hypothetical protein
LEQEYNKLLEINEKLSGRLCLLGDEMLDLSQEKQELQRQIDINERNNQIESSTSSSSGGISLEEEIKKADEKKQLTPKINKKTS